MKISIAMGFFLPVPPALGGATEKTWHRLAHELARRGHDVTVISRRWGAFADDENTTGVRYMRLPGFNHRRALWQNLALDYIWSRRVLRALPAAELVVAHAVALPIWLGRQRPETGRVVVMPGRIPKGQYRFYRNVARVMATSTPVAERVAAENPSLRAVTRVVGYPIDWQSFARPRDTSQDSAVNIGYLGRLHPEKGTDLLVEAIVRLSRDATLPSWRFAMRGPASVEAGGAGPAYRARIEARLRQALPAAQWSLADPLYDETQLADAYGSLDIFCYPSLASRGETFGVAVAEAMAAGAVPVVSDLACFRDFVRSDINGMAFDHSAPDAADRLANALAHLVRAPDRRQALASAARADVRRYDFSVYTDTLEKDFAELAAA